MDDCDDVDVDSVPIDDAIMMRCDVVIDVCPYNNTVGPGQCYRLYSLECFDNMMEETIPEIKRINLANTVLYLKALGIHDVLGFDFLDPPSEDQIMQVPLYPVISSSIHLFSLLQAIADECSFNESRCICQSIHPSPLHHRCL